MSLLNFATTPSSNPIPPVMQLLNTTRYLTTESFQSVIRGTLKSSQDLVSRIVRDVAKEIAGICSDIIKFTSGRRINQAKEGFL